MAESQKITVEMVQAAVTQFSNCKSNVQNSINQLLATVTRLGDTWQGNAYQAFMNKERELDKNLMTAITNIEGAINFLGNEVIPTYEAAEQANQQAINAITEAAGDYI